MGFGYLVFLHQTNKIFQKILSFDNKNTEIKNEFSSVKNIFNSSGKIQKKIINHFFYDLFLYGAQWLGFLDHLLRIFTIAPLCLGDSKVVIRRQRGRVTTPAGILYHSVDCGGLFC